MSNDVLKLHIGSGSQALPGWKNIDLTAGPGVDVALDVREGLPFEGVAYIFAEHFLEHLTLEEGLAFLRECRRVLHPDGVLRLSTPNLDWVWLTHYKDPSRMEHDEPLIGCLELNRAFHGWGHQFLYNLFTLTAALRSADFAHVAPRSYGFSEIAALRDLEKHELHDSAGNIPSVIVVEANGISAEASSFPSTIGPYIRDMAIR